MNVKIITLAFFLLSALGVRAQAQHFDQLINDALSNKDTTEAISQLVNKLKQADPTKSGALEIMGTNNQVYNLLFKYGRDKGQFMVAAGYMKKVISIQPQQYQGNKGMRANFIDTYANLLYKAGDVREALKWEEDAIADADHDQEAEFNGNLGKMKAGQPTW